jgi:hypothetical protein
MGLLCLTIAAPASAATSAGTLAGHFGGRSWATSASSSAGTTDSQLDRSAFLPCPCQGTDGNMKSNSVNQVNSPGTMSADKTLATAKAGKTDHNTASVRMTAKVTGLNALAGGVTADYVEGVATTTATRSLLDTSTNGSGFDNLVVQGQPVPSQVPPNTRRNLAGFGYMIMRETRHTGDGRIERGVGITMIHIYITQVNVLDLPVGSEMLIAAARSSYNRLPIQAIVSGAAFAASGEGKSQFENSVGRAALVTMGCEGTDGDVRANAIETTGVPNTVESGHGRSTASGTVTDEIAAATTSSRLQDLDILGGAISADEVRAVSRSTWKLSTDRGSVNSLGSGFENLLVNGNLVPEDVAPNTRVDLPGLGYAILYERTGGANATGANLKVTMIHVHITQGNPLGLAAGSELLIAAARSNASGL